MKKKISLLLCALIMALSLAGCSGKNEATYDAAEMESLSEFIISNFAQMEEADIQSFKDLSDFQLESARLPQDRIPVHKSSEGMLHHMQRLP